jgi:hypothetical protein
VLEWPSAAIMKSPFFGPTTIEHKLATRSGLPDLFLDTLYQNGGKTCHIATKLPNGHKIYQPYPIQVPEKFTQFGILGLKIYHLAPLNKVRVPNRSKKKLLTETIG